AGTANAQRRGAGMAVDRQAPALASMQALEDERAQAMDAGDVARLERLLAPGALYVHSNGVSEDGAAYLAGLATGAVGDRGITLEVTRLVHAGAAGCVLAGRMRGSVLKGGSEIQLRSLYLAVWQAGPPGEGWRLAAFQATREA